MTLINYINRVHFADDVLQEALWAELDQRPGGDVMVLSDPAHIDGDMAERFRAGLPVRKRVHVFADPVDSPTEARAAGLAAAWRDRGCSILVAFGAGPVIDLAKVVLLLVGQTRPLAELAETEGGGARIAAPLPDMIAVPSLPGLAAGLGGQASVTLLDGRRIDLSSPRLIPTVTICDPALISNASAAARASAGVAAVSCCIEALLSPGYNPPADGIAQDGLARALRSLAATGRGRAADLRRELMAAGLNAALVQQKGHGLAHAIASALDAVVPDGIDRGAAARLLLPEILGYYEAAGVAEPKAILDALGLPCGTTAAEPLRRRFSGLPLPSSLAEMGVPADRLTDVAALAARHRATTNGPRNPKPAEILAILQALQ